MIGNDIIDLSYAAKTSSWQHPRFLDKLFSSFEIEMIETSENKFVSIWKLWAMKEAGYKAYLQKTPGRFC